jgi:hypothetical protein
MAGGPVPLGWNTCDFSLVKNFLLFKSDKILHSLRFLKFKFFSGKREIAFFCRRKCFNVKKLVLRALRDNGASEGQGRLTSIKQGGQDKLLKSLLSFEELCQVEIRRFRIAARTKNILIDLRFCLDSLIMQTL